MKMYRYNNTFQFEKPTRLQRFVQYFKYKLNSYRVPGRLELVLIAFGIGLWCAVIFYLKLPSEKISRSGDFTLNLAAELFGVTIEVFVVYVLINVILERKNDSLWNPTREKILAKIFEDYIKFSKFVNVWSSEHYLAIESNEVEKANEKISKKDDFFNPEQEITSITPLRDELQYLSVAMSPNLLHTIPDYLDCRERCRKKLVYLNSPLSSYAERSPETRNGLKKDFFEELVMFEQEMANMARLVEGFLTEFALINNENELWVAEINTINQSGIGDKSSTLQLLINATSSPELSKTLLFDQSVSQVGSAFARRLAAQRQAAEHMAMQHAELMAIRRPTVEPGARPTRLTAPGSRPPTPPTRPAAPGSRPPTPPTRPAAPGPRLPTPPTRSVDSNAWRDRVGFTKS